MSDIYDRAFDASAAGPGFEYRGVHVENVPDIEPHELDLIFKEFGNPIWRRMLSGTVRGVCYGRAVVVYATGEEARQAFREAHGLRVNGAPPMLVTFWTRARSAIHEPVSSTFIFSGSGLPADPGIKLTGPLTSMDHESLSRYFGQFGDIHDISILPSRGPQARDEATVVFNRVSQALSARESLRDPTPGTYQMIERVLFSAPSIFASLTGHIMYIGNVPPDLDNLTIRSSLHQDGLVFGMVRLQKPYEQNPYIKVQFASIAHVADAVRIINYSGIAGNTDLRAERSLVWLQQSLLWPDVPAPVGRRPQGPRAPRDTPLIVSSEPEIPDPVIVSSEPVTRKRIHISGIRVAVTVTKEDVYNAIIWYDTPGTEYGFIHVRFHNNGRDAIVTFKTSDGASHTLERMTGEKFGGLSPVTLALID